MFSITNFIKRTFFGYKDIDIKKDIDKDKDNNNNTNMENKDFYNKSILENRRKKLEEYSYKKYKENTEIFLKEDKDNYYNLTENDYLYLIYQEKKLMYENSFNISLDLKENPYSDNLTSLKNLIRIRLILSFHEINYNNFFTKVFNKLAENKYLENEINKLIQSELEELKEKDIKRLNENYYLFYLYELISILNMFLLNLWNNENYLFFSFLNRNKIKEMIIIIYDKINLKNQKDEKYL
jgi:hypothetical protein